MKPFFFLLAAALSVAISSHAAEFADHAYFSRAIGSWTGEGELTNVEGETSQIKEEWVAKLDVDGSFVITGNREWNGESFEFRWVYHYNAANELYEVDYWQTGMEEDLRMEASVTDNRIELKAPFGDAGAELRVVNVFVNGNIESDVEITDAQGVKALGGQLIHSKTE